MRVIEEEEGQGDNRTGGRVYSANVTLTYYRDPVIEAVLPGRVHTSDRALVTVAGRHIERLDGARPVHCIYTVGDNSTYAVLGFVSGRLLHCQPLRWREVAWARGVALQVSFNYVSRSAPVRVPLAAPPLMRAEQWAALAVLAVLALAGEAVLLCVLRQRRAADGYARISRGNVAVDVREIVLGASVGRGSCAEVFRGTWRGAVVAVKRFRVGAVTDAFVREFEREVALMRSLRSPHIVQFLGSALDPPRDVCIVTEYMARGSLYGVLRDSAVPLAWDLLLAMAQDAARGMVYLHTCTPPIIHRDLKSQNILVDEFWRCKVADFGLSTVLGQQQSQASLTMTACGTPCWTAPEVLRATRYSPKADVYSFAVVLWECLCRADPYPGLPAFRVIVAVGEGLRPTVPPWCPHAYADLMRRCWAERPADRPDFVEILPALADIAALGWKGQPSDMAAEYASEDHGNNDSSSATS